MKNSKKHKISNLGYYYWNDLWFSDAYLELTKSARNLLHCLFSELRWTGKGKNKQYTNNGSVSFTERQFKDQFRSSSQTYLNARNQLIVVGFIKQTYRGGMCRGDMAKYEVLCVDGVKLENQRWLNYPKENWMDQIPRSKDTLVGNKTRFKKGVSGRKKSITTLKNNTLNGTILPKDFDPNLL